MARGQKLIHLHGTSQIDEGVNSIELAKGEIAVRNAAAGAAELYVTDASGANIVAFIDKGGVNAIVNASAVKTKTAYESAIEEAVNIEKLRAEGKEGELLTAINTEKNRAEGAEADLQGLIDAMDEAYKAADDSLKTTLEGQISDAQSALQTKIDNEATARQEADADLAERLDAVETMLGDSEGSVSDMIADAVKEESDRAKGEEAKIRGEFAAADTALKTELQGYAEGQAADALGEAKTYAEGQAAAALAEAKTYAEGKASAAQAAAEKTASDALSTFKNGEFKTHVEDGDIHITAQERIDWNKAKSDIDFFLNENADIDDTINTLKEIQHWLDSEGVIAGEITEAIAGEAKLREEADKALETAYKNADTALKTELEGYAEEQAADALGEAKTYAEGQAATAKSEAITAAAADAKSKADTALADAKAYADQAEADALADAKTYTETRLGDIAADTTVKAYVDAAKAAAVEAAAGDATNKANKAKDDAIAAAAIDATNKANTAEANAIAAAAGDATNKANTAEANAIAAAAGDATKKANTAEANAKAFVNDLGGGDTGNGTYVTVQVTSAGGKVTDVVVNENYSNLVIDCGEYDA
jgi:hypothetical protein